MPDPTLQEAVDELRRAGKPLEVKDNDAGGKTIFITESVGAATGLRNVIDLPTSMRTSALDPFRVRLGWIYETLDALKTRPSPEFSKNHPRPWRSADPQLHRGEGRGGDPDHHGGEHGPGGGEAGGGHGAGSEHGGGPGLGHGPVVK